MIKNDLSIEVLVACMYQDDDSLYEKMNLHTNAVFANQHDKFEYKTINKAGKELKIITTADRGVGKNRNLSILNSSSDILLFSDEDIVLYDDYEEKIKSAFKEHPKADSIIFNLSYSKNGVVYKTTAEKTKKVKIHNAMRYGAARIAIKRESLLRANIWFSQLYGGGARYSAGEDSLFIIDMLKKKLNVYTGEYVLGCTAKDNSSWFDGYTDKYYRDKGAWVANAYPTMKYVLGLYFAVKLRNTSKKSVIEIYRLIIQGIRRYDQNLI